MDRTPQPLSSGAVVARRFVLRELAGRGGMGEVWRARDSMNGEDVALKLLHTDATALDTERFAREARILSEIRHPRIVSYVAHGTCETHGPFLTMQWLEGEDLAHRLARGPLSTGEALLVLRRIAEPLAALHARGVVHRDLKPSNVLLLRGDIDQATILDLGIARTMGPPTDITASGKCIGTPEYMSPEQIRSERPLEPSSDVFSLGCILFECLAGQRPFASPDPVSLLAKILLEAAPPLLTLRPGVPRAVDALVQRMLEKQPEKRPQDAAELLAELASSFDWEPKKGAFSPTIARDTPELVSVIFAKTERAPGDAGLHAAAAMLARHGARVHEGPRGELVATFSQIGTGATDQTAAAARAAITLASQLPASTVALTTGLALVDAERPIGEAIDRASQEGRAEGAPRGLVTACALTTSLLDSRFQTSRIGAFLCVVQDTGPRSSVRPVLGSETPFVGRELELDILTGAFDGCKEDPRARAILVTGAAGVGKSRLVEEFSKRLQTRGENARILHGRGELRGRTRAFAMIEGAVSTLVTGAGPAARKSGFGELLTLAERLGDGASADLANGRATRAQLERVFLDGLAAECAAHPVVLVIEDVHHVDGPSLELVTRALASLASFPLFVIALGQPEPLSEGPSLFEGRAERLALSPLGPRIAERIARRALGPGASDSVVSEIVLRAGGNPFFLEELVRANAEGKGAEAPQSLVAMLQARLGRLDPDARRVLVAASVFGARFLRGGVGAVLDGEGDGRVVSAALGALVAADLIEPRPHGRRAGEAARSEAPADEEFVFRQALVREAAHGLLGDDERALGHARAAAFLEDRGFEDAAILAEHWRHAGNAERAKKLHLRAARAAFETNDRDGTRSHAEKAERLGAEGTELGIVRAMAACALFWSRDWPAACEVGLSALPLLSRGSAWSCRVLGIMCVITGVGIRAERFVDLFEELVTTNPDWEATSVYIESIGRVLCLVAMRLDRRGAERTRARLLETVEKRGAVDADAHGWARFAMYEHGRSSTHAPRTLAETIEDAARAFEESGDERMVSLSLGCFGEALASLGRSEEAERKLREAVSVALANGEPYIAIATRLLLATYLAEREDPGARAEARALGISLIEDARLAPFDTGFARGLLARLALAEGDLEAALVQVDLGLVMLPRLGVRRVSLLATRMRVLTRLGRVAEAVSITRDVQEAFVQAGLDSVGAWDVDLRTATAEVFRAAGDTAAFEAELRIALAALAYSLGDVADPEEQTRLMREVPENALAARMSREHFGVLVLPTE